MAHEVTEVTYFFRAAVRDFDLRWDRVTPDSEGYGKVHLVKKTRTERRAAGDVGRVLDWEEREEILLTVDAEDTSNIARSLPRAVAASLRVKKKD